MSKLCYPKEIIGTKFENNTCYYLVQWKGYKTPTWEPEHHISHRTDLIKAYRDMVMIDQLNMKSSGYIYCRVSSKEQSKYTDGHTSLQVQEKEIRKYCDEKDINIIQVVNEVYSARNMNKLKGLQYLCNIAAPGHTIFVYDISRFSRNAHHALNLLEELTEKKVNVVSVSENISYGGASDRNQFRLQLCMATYHSDICSQKVRASLEYRRERGDYIGGTPFGYTTEVDEKTQIRTKVPSPEEMRIVEIIRSNSRKHPAHIVDLLIKKNITLRNRQPTCSGVSRIISRFQTDLKPTKQNVTKNTNSLDQSFGKATSVRKNNRNKRNNPYNRRKNAKPTAADKFVPDDYKHPSM